MTEYNPDHVMYCKKCNKYIKYRDIIFTEKIVMPDVHLEASCPSNHHIKWMKHEEPWLSRLPKITLEEIPTDCPNCNILTLLSVHRCQV